MLVRLVLCVTALLAFTQTAFGQAALGKSYADKRYLQDYAVKYPLLEAGVDLRQVRSDRNGVVQVLSSRGLPKSGLTYELTLPWALVLR